MAFVRKLLNNHVLSWLTFVLVILIGSGTYLNLPRQQDPTINFNWIDITTLAPGLSSSDVELKVTNVLEDALESLDDVDFAQSTSSDGLSSVLIRFNDISPAEFQSRIIDLRREVDAAKDDLPDVVFEPVITEITTSNAFPSAMVLLESPANDETLRYNAGVIADEIENIDGVDKVDVLGTEDPELQVRFDPTLLSAYEISPTLIADTIASYYQDIAAGDINIQDLEWNIRIQGTSPDPDAIARIPLLTPNGQITIGELAEVAFTRAEAVNLISSHDKPSVLLTISKVADSNLLQMVDQINAYIAEKNISLADTGLKLVLLDDQTAITRNALSIMQNNALVGLLLVLIVSWLFLGRQVAFLTCIGIPFTLAATFIVLGQLDQTLNQTILLGVVIALGMIVDDAVVVVESIYYRLQRGMSTLDAAVDSLREVAIPVVTAVLTTIAIFLPLMLVPGILGKFLLVIPLVVTVALLVSLIEAFWMLPSHLDSLYRPKQKNSAANRIRQKALTGIRHFYSKWLIKALRRPVITLVLTLSLIGGSFGVMAFSLATGGPIKFDFFASDTVRLFYLNVDMPTGTPLEKTLDKVKQVESRARENLSDEELRGIASISGIKYTEVAPVFGNQYGQVVISLNQRTDDGRRVEEIIRDLEAVLYDIPGIDDLSSLKLTGGPPTSKPIQVKILSNDDAARETALSEISAYLATVEGVENITDDSEAGINEVVLTLDDDAVRRIGFQPNELQRVVRLMSDGETVSSLRYLGENVGVKVLAEESMLTNPLEWLDFMITSASGDTAYLSDVFDTTLQTGKGSIKHYNFIRNNTLEADIDPSVTDTVQANNQLITFWESIQANYPNVQLDFSGELDDIQESLSAMGQLFLLGLLLIYLILGTQFNSFFQPFLILTTIPLAFSGVILGILFSNNPVSLYTMYGIVALMGIAVNTAIVLIAAANDRLNAGMTPQQAIVFASKRRVIPILITACTTIAGLFSLATGLAGSSLIWGPIANAIVWGLGFSTVLTLFVIPTLYLLFHRRKNVQHS